MKKSGKKSRKTGSKEHIAGQITFLVCVAHDDHSAVAARFAAMRAQNSGGGVALLHVTQPPEFQHWATVGERMREETREAAEVMLERLAGEVESMLGAKPSLHLREGRIGGSLSGQPVSRNASKPGQGTEDLDSIWIPA